MTQYRMELRRILKSVIFLLMAAGIVLFAYTQGVFPPDSTITKPEPNRSYGMKPSNDPALIMPEAAESLLAQYSENKYITYPNGFYKVIRLNKADRIKMAGIIDELSNPEITWEHFKDLIAQADKLLGGGSDFSETWIYHRFGRIPVTYEEALKDYELTISHDKMSNAHARLFSDYIGIILGLLPVFPAVFLCMCDRKNIAPALYTRRISSARFILARFFALATATMLPVLLMGFVLTCMHAANYSLGNIDILAYFKYAFFWIFPTAIAAISVGLFFTTLTNTPVAIAVQLVWWFTDILGGKEMYLFFGVRTLQLVPRHNELGNVEIYMDYLPSLVQNRIRIVLIAALLVAGTIYIFSARRRGLLYVPILKRGKIQSAV